MHFRFRPCVERGPWGDQRHYGSWKFPTALRISNSARQSISVGEAANLIAVDAQRFVDTAPFIHFAWSFPIIIIYAFYFLWRILGCSKMVVGLLVEVRALSGLEEILKK
ncbi:Canalicular multispecific organic anion transporter 2 [Homalodisca vitripennis]|nr:Canalicular multispecific organic anion transporter 2 [Homalodisca vitripennis]